MADIDRASIQTRGIPGFFLMERAGQAVAAHVAEQWHALNDPRPVLILVGRGNNGGDGLVAARYLAVENIPSLSVLFGSQDQLSPDNLANLLRLEDVADLAHTIPAEQANAEQGLSQSALVVDALLGTGAKGMLRPPYLCWVKSVNSSGLPVVAVDIPSGICADDGTLGNTAIRATSTVSFGLSKIGHWVPPGCDYRGLLTVVPLPFPPDLLANAESEAELVEPDDVLQALPHRTLSAHKGANGKLLIFAGSCGMTGAAVLAAEGALAAGAGLITVACPQSQQPIIASQLREAMTLPIPTTDNDEFAPEALEVILKQAHAADVVAIGPGLGRTHFVQELIRAFVAQLKCPVVLDADGLIAFHEHLDALKTCVAPLVLTPHPGELGVLLNQSVPLIQAQRWQSARQLALELGATVVLKGLGSVIASPQKLLRINPTGNPGMAQGGMGDVLTGIIAALVGQGLDTDQAAWVGTYLHGMVADNILAQRGGWTLRAHEIVQQFQPVVGAWIHALRNSRADATPEHDDIFLEEE